MDECAAVHFQGFLKSWRDEEEREREVTIAPFPFDYLLPSRCPAVLRKMGVQRHGKHKERVLVYLFLSLFFWISLPLSSRLSFHLSLAFFGIATVILITNFFFFLFLLSSGYHPGGAPRLASSAHLRRQKKHHQVRGKKRKKETVRKTERKKERSQLYVSMCICLCLHPRSRGEACRQE